MKHATVTRHAWWKVTLAAGLLLLAAACGAGGGGSQSGSSSPASPSSSAPASPANAALCADVAALRASLNKLTHVSVGAGTASEIQADLKDVQAKLTALGNQASGQWQAQTSALKSALAKLQTAAKTLAASPSASAVASVVSALGDVNTAAQNLLAAANTQCPSASPSG